MKNELQFAYRVLGRNPLLCVVIALPSPVPRENVSMLFHLLCFLRVPWNKSACPSEQRISALSKIDRHVFRDSVPRTVWFVSKRSVPFFFRSRSEELTNVLREALRRTGILWAHFFISFFVPIDVAVHRHEDDSIVESFGLNVVFSPSCFGLLGLASAWCAQGKCSTRARLVLHRYCPAHDTEEIV